MLQRHLGLQSEELLGARDLMPMSDCNLYGNRQVPATYPHNLHYLNIIRISGQYLDIVNCISALSSALLMLSLYILIIIVRLWTTETKKHSLLQPAASNRRLALLQWSQCIIQPVKTCTYPNCLVVVSTPLKNMSSSVGIIIPNIWKIYIMFSNHQPAKKGIINMGQGITTELAANAASSNGPMCRDVGELLNVSCWQCLSNVLPFAKHIFWHNIKKHQETQTWLWKGSWGLMGYNILANQSQSGSQKPSPGRSSARTQQFPAAKSLAAKTPSPGGPVDGCGRWEVGVPQLFGPC